MPPEAGNAYDLIAAFVDIGAARQAIQALQAEGIEGRDISLLGREGPEVQSDDATTDDRTEFRAAIEGTVGGGIGGGVLGGLAGFLIGLAATAVPGLGPVVTAGVWAAAALGALAGADAGALVGVITGGELSSERAEAYATHLSKGHVLLGVRADDPNAFEHAFEVIARQQPLAIDRFGPGLPSGKEEHHVPLRHMPLRGGA